MATLLHTDRLVCRRAKMELFAPVSLRVDEGGRIALKGPNGSGKTSLLRALAGLLPHEGTLTKNTGHTYIGHRDAVTGDLTPCEHFEFWQDLALSRRVIFFGDIIKQAGLGGLEHRRAATLSAGQRQRLALCRLLIEDAKLWLLDEPFSALDDEGERFLERLLDTHRENGGGAIIASHGAVKNAEDYKLRVA